MIAIMLIILVSSEFLARTFYKTRLINVVPHPILNHTWRANTVATHGEYVNRGIKAYIHSYNKQSWIETFWVMNL